jgi:alkylhydroperoxidase family enzyme
MRAVLMIAAAAMLAACATSAPEASAPQGFTPRLTTPRLAVVDPAAINAEQRAMLASRNDMNIYKTLAHHPGLYAKWSPLGQFLLNGSSLPPRHREMAMLRMGWLCQAPYEWSAHARIAQASAGMTAAEVRRIAEGPDAPGWSEADRAVLRMVDDMRYEAMISNTTWAALKTTYTDNQVMELLYTAAQYQLVSMALNSLGVQRDPNMADPMPTDLPLPAPALHRPRADRLATPRLALQPVAGLTPEQRELVRPRLRADGTLPNLYATLIVHPRLYGPRSTFGTYIQREGLLPPQARELLIMRTAYLIRANYEWAHHAELAKQAGLTDADIARIAIGPGDPAWSHWQRPLLQAADDLRREAFISEPTWRELSKHFDTKQMIEIIYTVGAYTMTGNAINSFGIQTEPGYPSMPG